MTSMRPDSLTLPSPGRSGFRPLHLRRPDVCRYWLRRALDETPLTMERFTERLVETYCRLVPAHARRLSLHELSTAMPHSEYATALGAMVKLVQRYLQPEGHLHFPAEIEEAWAQALPPPYDDQCRHELVRRHGCMGVDVIEALAPAEDLRGVADVMGAAADIARRCTAMYEHGGGLGPQDAAEAPDAIRACREAAGRMLGLASRIEKAVLDTPEDVDAG